MKNKRIALIVASVLTTNSMAFAGTMAVDTLKANVILDKAAAMSLLSKSDANTASDLIMTYNEVKKLSESLRAIQTGNESDILLNYANKFQVALVGASAIALNSHIKDSEKSRIAFHIAAASALLNTFIRHYTEAKSLKPSELGSFITRFTHEMTESKELTPEMVEMANSLNKISTDLISQKTQIDTIVAGLGGGSDLATGVLLILSIAHYVNPKVADQGEAILKSMGRQMAAGGAGIAKNSKVVGTTGAAAGAPDLIGITLGLDSQKSQEMIAKTLNNLDIAARTLQLQIKSK